MDHVGIRSFVLLRLCPDVLPHENRAQGHEAANRHVVERDPADKGRGQGQIQHVNHEAPQRRRWPALQGLLLAALGGLDGAGENTGALDDGADDGGEDGVEPELVGFHEYGRVPGHDVYLHVVELVYTRGSEENSCRARDGRRVQG